MTDSPFPWAHLDAIEVARIEALPFESAVCALLDAAKPRASAKQVHEEWDWPEPKPLLATIKRVMAQWKVTKVMGRTDEDAETERLNMPVRTQLENMMREAARTDDADRVRKIAAAIVQLDKAGPEAAVGTTEDWSRLNDPETACMVALVRKLNGEDPTEADVEWLTWLR